jgi:hypothetical protein
MIFGKTGLQGPGASHAGDSSAPGLLADRGLLGSPYSHMGHSGRLGEGPNTWKHFGPESDPDSILSW